MADSTPREDAALADVLAQDARQAALEALYEADGRADRSHPHHSLFTGLVAGFTTTTEQETHHSVLTVGTGIAAARLEAGTASAYRLVRRNGELLLQGAYQWQQGCDAGITWRDIPTEQESTDDCA